MSCGKYSPTVAGWYSKDQDWHDQHRDSEQWFDRDGYDSYGYDGSGRDRAGYTEWDYLGSGEWIEDIYSYPLYERVLEEWRRVPCPVDKL